MIGRWFAVTGERVPGTPDEIASATDAWQWLADRIVRQRGGAKARPSPRAKAPAGVVGSDELDAYLKRDPDLARLWRGEKAEGDTSASGKDASLAMRLANLDAPDDVIAHALRTYPHGQNDERQIERLLAKVNEAREIAHLAALSPVDYDKVREKKAKELGVRVSTLDAEVVKRRPSEDDERSSGRSFTLDDPEPWHSKVDGAALLDEIVSIFSRHLSMPAHAAAAVALWVVHTYAFTASTTTPRLAITSPEKRCGKTTCLKIVQTLVSRPIMSANLTAAVVFRVVEDHRPTLLIDEADTFLRRDNDELRGILNSGHDSSGGVLRTVGDDHEPRLFSTWAPCAIAAIGKLPGTLEDRSIQITMQRRARGEEHERWRSDKPERFHDLRRKCVRWAQDKLEALRASDPDVPDELHDRARDNWRPLLAIADEVGERWSGIARAAAIGLSGESDSEGIREMLLEDIRTIFTEGRVVHELKDGPWIQTEKLLTELHKLTERPWCNYKHGRAMGADALRSLLLPFKIYSTKRSVFKRECRGYALRAFEDAFSRYLRDTPLSNASTRRSPSKHAGSDHIERVDVHPSVDASQTSKNPANMRVVDASTRRTGGTTRKTNVVAFKGAPSRRPE